ncbi:MAG: hypothetical protein JSS99_13730 [Actinobacteria bacterium]|nr:hypothetical protein [Actinomycetota bacterium]
MSHHGGDRRASTAQAPERRVAPRMTLLAALGIAAGIVFGTFAAILTLVAGLALLALDAEHHARVASRLVRTEAQRQGARLSAGAAAASERRSAVTQRRHLPRTTP